MGQWTPWGIIWVIVILTTNPTGNTNGSGESDDGPPSDGGVIGPP